ncbi:MAG: hypothetical protein LBC18_05955 [Opitutaceae bacterium]|nr:hypothetical protein [Opitutaceae bacterium]
MGALKKMREAMTALLDNADAIGGLVWDELLAFQDSDGSFKLLDSYKVESDARVDFCHVPTYIGAAILMRRWLDLKRDGKSADEEDTRKRLAAALKASCHRNLRGHGFDDFPRQLDALDIFIKGGLKAFLETENVPEFFPEFYKMVTAVIIGVSTQLHNNDCKGAWNGDYKERMQKIMGN